MFKLDFEIPKSNIKINRKDKILLSGSCFSDEMGKKFSSNKFDTLANPFGTLFNPYSILGTISGDVVVNDFIESQGIYHHWDAHGSLSGLSKSELIKNIEGANKKTHAFIKQANWIIFTFGTAFVYQLKASGRIVANCHKVPQSAFDKRLLSIDEIFDSFTKAYQKLKAINPKIQFILTISPVRHIKDGLIENNHSKALLLSATHKILQEFPATTYFPAYEILIDELRDYRFYQSDMVHPSAQAVDYVWDKFVNTYFDETSIQFLKNWQQIKRALQHRPINPSSKDHQRFLHKTFNQLNELKQDVDVSAEIESIKAQLI